ncbi:cysteine desulfurase NifS [Rhodomicrobium vannielii ATCC 17100]|uniref:cysteine desulfurase NifS n=1 Tax=Rhodomicrobium vannielii TaxID=1069 RepID=UPI001918D588|nr:cysteine desulfurase NifS [Rhodomicrobium vannielii]MBJ7534941.1 cysteine desulfurase NifS [Rhodomicrobium vannielii ATCC 17100]
MHPVYLDNNATTRLDPAVLAEMLPFFTQHFGNASSIHGFGKEVGAAIHRARDQVRALIGAAQSHEIVFTSGGTESDNTALLSALETQTGRTEIVTSAVEHPAILALVQHLQRHRGVTVHIIGVDGKGRLDMDAYRAALGPKTAIASVMWANNETGTIFPVAELARLAHEAGALFHTDAVQVAGRIPIDVKVADIDMLSLSSHKFHGPKGIGALYIKKGVAFHQLIRGGKQERGRRAGTENAPGIVGLGKAAELALKRLQGGGCERVRQIRDAFEIATLSRIDGAFVAGDIENRLPNTSNIVFDRAEGEVILLELDKAGIAASSGSACAAGSTEPSHVLRAMKVPYAAALGAIRFSFAHTSTDEDLGRVLAKLPAIVEKAREASGFAATMGEMAQAGLGAGVR